MNTPEPAAPAEASSPSQAVQEGLEVPPPHGWIGTTSEWIRGSGLVFGFLNLVLLVVVWRMLKRQGRHGDLQGPALRVDPRPSRHRRLPGDGQRDAGIHDGRGLRALPRHGGPRHGPARSQERLAGGGPLQEPLHPGEPLLHVPQRLRDVRHRPAPSSRDSGHVCTTRLGDYPKPIKIAHPYPNVRCLNCHAGSQKFLAKHEPDELAEARGQQGLLPRLPRPRAQAEETRKEAMR